MYRLIVNNPVGTIITFGGYHTTLQQVKGLCEAVQKSFFNGKNGILRRYRKTSFGDKKYKSYTVMHVRVETPISDNEIAILDTRYPETMGDIISTDSPKVALIDTSKSPTFSAMNLNNLRYYSGTLDRDVLEDIIKNDSMIPLEQLIPIWVDQTYNVVVRLFEERCLFRIDDKNDVKYTITNIIPVIEAGDSIIIEKYRIIIHKQNGSKTIISHKGGFYR